MATATVTGPGTCDTRTVLLTRWQRDALHREIREFGLRDALLSDFHCSLTKWGRAEEARRVWLQMACCARLLDQIGWDEFSADDTYTVAIDDEIVGWIRRNLADAKGALNDAWPIAGEDTDVDVARARELTDSDLEFIAACYAILNTLEATR